MLKKHTFQIVLFHLALLLGLFMPTKNISYLIQGIFPAVIFIFNRPTNYYTYNKSAAIIIFVIILSFIANIFTYNLSLQSFFRFLSLFLLFGLFPFTKSIKIWSSIVYAALLYILLSQIAYAWGINSLVVYFDALYPYTGDRLGYQSDYLLKSAGNIETIVNRRYGGLYHNPNQCVRYVSLLYIIFLISSKSTRKLVQKIPFIALVYISVLLSGSRTGLVVVTLITIYDMMVFTKVTVSLTKYFFSILLGSSLIFFYFLLENYGFRVFQIIEGNFDSFNSKFFFFFNYIEQLDSPIKFFLGNFSNDNIKIYDGLSQLDSEWGELFYNYGLLGILSFGIFYYSLWSTKNQEIRFYMLILLWGLTSTIIFSFRMSFVFMLLLSNLYSSHKYKSVAECNKT